MKKNSWKQINSNYEVWIEKRNYYAYTKELGKNRLFFAILQLKIKQKCILCEYHVKIIASINNGPKNKIKPEQPKTDLLFKTPQKDGFQNTCV